MSLLELLFLINLWHPIKITSFSCIFPCSGVIIWGQWDHGQVLKHIVYSSLCLCDMKQMSAAPGKDSFIEMFRAHWHPVAVFMTHCARHTTKQLVSLKGVETNQYRQNQTLIIHRDKPSEAHCYVQLTSVHIRHALHYFMISLIINNNCR